ncbi:MULTISPECIES: hypothetical protein [unclassified Bradyrhizobium]
MSNIAFWIAMQRRYNFTKKGERLRSLMNLEAAAGDERRRRNIRQGGINYLKWKNRHFRRQAIPLCHRAALAARRQGRARLALGRLLFGFSIVGAIELVHASDAPFIA